MKRLPVKSYSWDTEAHSWDVDIEMTAATYFVIVEVTADDGTSERMMRLFHKWQNVEDFIDVLRVLESLPAPQVATLPTAQLKMIEYNRMVAHGYYTDDEIEKVLTD